MIALFQRPTFATPVLAKRIQKTPSSIRNFQSLVTPPLPLRTIQTRAMFNMFGSKGNAPISAAATLHELKVEDAMGSSIDLSAYKGKVVLVVNVASRCGLTPQYKDLAALDAKYGSSGFAILAQPCNQFGAQEPGTSAEICDFASNKYQAKFKILAKGDVNGANTTQLYSFLKTNSKTGDIGWNFGKYLVGKDGKVIKYYAPTTGPMALENDIITALKA